MSNSSGRDRLEDLRERRAAAKAKQDRQGEVDAAHAPTLQALRDSARVVEEDELERLVRVVQEQGWDPWEQREAGRISVDSGGVHYQKHVVDRQEWPVGTSRQDYDASIRRVIADRNTSILVSEYNDKPTLTFHGRALPGEQGPRGRDYIVVDYSMAEARWTTAFQTDEDADTFIARSNRSGGRWL